MRKVKWGEGELYTPSYDVKDIYRRRGLTGIGSTVELIGLYYSKMDRETQDRADRTIRCLETGEVFNT